MFVGGAGGELIFYTIFSAIPAHVAPQNAVNGNPVNFTAHDLQLYSPECQVLLNRKRGPLNTCLHF